MLESQLCYYCGELWKQFLPKGPIKVLATVDISLHIGIYLSVYTRNFNVPFSNLECSFFFNFPELYPLDMMILHVYPTQGDENQGIDFHCDIHVSVLKAADFIKALLIGLQ